jgi:hypothetical protein
VITSDKEACGICRHGSRGEGRIDETCPSGGFEDYCSHSGCLSLRKIDGVCQWLKSNTTSDMICGR